MLDGTPAAQAAAALVARVKEEYGALLSDICYRIENPALFDPADAAAKRLARALIRWDDNQGRLDPSELSVAAAEVRVAFDAERAAALRQVSAILDGLALYYLPNPAEATLMIEGRPPCAAGTRRPGRDRGR